MFVIYCEKYIDFRAEGGWTPTLLLATKYETRQEALFAVGKCVEEGVAFFQDMEVIPYEIITVMYI